MAIAPVLANTSLVVVKVVDGILCFVAHNGALVKLIANEPKRGHVTGPIVVKSRGSATCGTRFSREIKESEKPFIDVDALLCLLSLLVPSEALGREDFVCRILRHDCNRGSKIVASTLRDVNRIWNEETRHDVVGTRHRVMWRHIVPQGRNEYQF